MKKRETKKTVLWAATDMALSVAAMAAAFFIRFVLFRGENPVGGFGYHMLWAGLFSPVYAVLFGCSHLRAAAAARLHPRIWKHRSRLHVRRDAVYRSHLRVPRGGLFALDDPSLLSAAHRVHRRARLYCAPSAPPAVPRRKWLRRLVIIGDGASARECLRRVKKGRDAGWTVIGSLGASALSGVPHLGSYDSLAHGARDERAGRGGDRHGGKTGGTARRDTARMRGYRREAPRCCRSGMNICRATRMWRSCAACRW